jgi:DNA-binding IclR family transcriptional regulator
LVDRGYIRRDAATDELTLSNRLFELGMRTPRSRQLVEVAIPAMERMSDRIGHSSHLVVVNKGETVVIATAAGSAEVGLTLRLGYRRPALDATSGRVIIAFQDPARRKEMIGATTQPKGVTMSMLIKNLDKIKSKGFLTAPSHDVVSVTDVCAPILNNRKHAMASIVVPCLNRHGTGQHHEDIANGLIETCQVISAGLR